MTGFSTVLAGRGGQGILLAARILMEEALLRGQSVRGSETHGMAQRGGSVVAHIRTGRFHSPLVPPASAHLLLALEYHEGLRHLARLRRSGLLVVNAPDDSFVDEATRSWLEDRGALLLTVDATGWAHDSGLPRSANMFMVGVVGAHSRTPYEPEVLREAIRQTVRSRYLESCLGALEAGISVGLELPS